LFTLPAIAALHSRKLLTRRQTLCLGERRTLANAAASAGPFQNDPIR
jgi:hypothetical protein